MKSGYYLRFSLIFFTCLVIQAPGKAQYEIKALPRWLVSGHFLYMEPQDPVKRFLEGEDWGYHVELQYRVQYNKPILAGLYFSEAGLDHWTIRYDDGDLEIREKANTRRLEAGCTAGVYPEINWLLQPYVQGRLGLALYHSSTIIVDRDSDEVLDRFKELSRFVSSYGLDVGIHIVPNIWYLRGDVRVGVVANPSVKFLALNEELKGSVQYPIEAFEEHVSSGRWLKVSLGLSYLF